jgi:hypothetical protein
MTTIAECRHTPPKTPRSRNGYVNSPPHRLSCTLLKSIDGHDIIAQDWLLMIAWFWSLRRFAYKTNTANGIDAASPRASLTSILKCIPGYTDEENTGKYGTTHQASQRNTAKRLCELLLPHYRDNNTATI